MLFWIFAGLMTILVILIIVSPFLKKQNETTLSMTSDMAVYRDQLSELKKDVARGILSQAEAEASRTEISRRLLTADARQTSQAQAAPKDHSKIANIILIGALLIGAPLTYALIGSPGAKDQPLSERSLRLSQEEAELQYLQNGGVPPRSLDTREQDLLSRLREALAERPDDLTGHKLLVQTLNSIGDFAGASNAQDEVIRIQSGAVPADDYGVKAELMIFAAGGYVSPEAEQTLAQLLEIDPTNRQGRYYSGLSMAQNGKTELALQLWSRLLSEGPPDAPWKAAVRAQIEALTSATGRPTSNPPLSGPDQSDIEAASSLSSDERQEMIRNMVQGLSDRLASDGGTADEWARLIRALTVLGDQEQAKLIFLEAQAVFADDSTSLTTINEAASSAGLE